MVIKIGSTNSASLFAQRQLSAATSRLSNASEQLSSGLRINRASDNAAGLAIASLLQSSTRVYGQAIRDINDGISTLNIADGAMQQLDSILQRQKELAEQSANGVYKSTQRNALQTESNQLTAEYNRIIATTRFNNMPLIDGSYPELQLQAGTDGSASSGLTVDFSGLVTTATGTGTYQVSSGTKEADNFDFNGAMACEVTQFSVSDGSTTSDGDYLTYHTMCSGEQIDRYIWFDVYGGAVDPGLSNPSLGTGTEVHINSGETADEVVNDIIAALAGVAPSEMSIAADGGSSFTITNLQAGNVRDGSGSVTTQGSGVQQGDYFLFSTPVRDYYAWFDYGIGGSTSVAGRTGIQVQVNTSINTDDELRDAALAAIQAAVSEVTVSAGSGSESNWLKIADNLAGAVAAPVGVTSSSFLPGGIPSVFRTAGTTCAIDTVNDTLAIANHALRLALQLPYRRVARCRLLCHQSLTMPSQLTVTPSSSRHPTPTPFPEQP